jgi:hypothetical protein
MVSDLKKLVSFQNLSDSSGTPLMEFRGLLVDYTVKPPDKLNRTYVDFMFQDLEPDSIVSKVPYPFPTAIVSIKYTTRKNSSWGILGASMAAILGSEADVEDLKGKVQTWKKTPGHEFGIDKATGKTMVAEIFEIMEIDGMVPEPAEEEPAVAEEPVPAPVAKAAPKSAPKPTPPAPKPAAKPVAKKAAGKITARDSAINLMDGKSPAQFFQEAFTNEAIKADAQVMGEIASGPFVNSVIAQGLVTKGPDDIYHKA